jgi:flavin-dependent dehydrogenase
MNIDVAVIGSGPAGCASAIACHRDGLDVVLVALRTTSEPFSIPETLPPAGGKYLESLGLWPQFQHCHFREHHSMISLWGEARATERHSISNPSGAGWYLDRATFDKQMLAAALEQYSIPAVPERLIRSARQGDGWRLTMNQGHIEAKVVMDCTGRNASFARSIGIKRVELDRQICIWAQCYPTSTSGTEAFLEAGQSGWWFSAPTQHGGLCVAYFTDPDLLNRAWRSPAGWHTLMETTEQTRARVHSVIPGTLRTRIASSNRLEKCAGEGWLAVGDAAMAFDPLASQGLLQSFDSAQAACESVPGCLAREAGATEEYEAKQTKVWERFVDHRHYFYGMERRWPDSEFWKRRSATGARQASVSPH